MITDRDVSVKKFHWESPHVVEREIILFLICAYFLPNSEETFKLTYKMLLMYNKNIQ